MEGCRIILVRCHGMCWQCADAGGRCMIVRARCTIAQATGLCSARETWGRLSRTDRYGRLLIAFFCNKTTPPRVIALQVGVVALSWQFGSHATQRNPQICTRKRQTGRQAPEMATKLLLSYLQTDNNEIMWRRLEIDARPSVIVLNFQTCRLLQFGGKGTYIPFER